MLRPQDTLTNDKVTEFAIALGSNWDKNPDSNTKYLTRAVALLSSKGFKIIVKSRLFSTPAFPAGNGPDFVNAVILAKVSMPVRDILNKLHSVENEMGRARPTRWAQRVIDLDLLHVGQRVIPNESLFNDWRNMPLERQVKEAPDQLILPHPRLQDRGFVLVPLCDVAPDWRHPVLGKTATEMLNDLDREDVESVVPIGAFPEE